MNNIDDDKIKELDKIIIELKIKEYDEKLKELGTIIKRDVEKIELDTIMELKNLIEELHKLFDTVRLNYC